MRNSNLDHSANILPLSEEILGANENTFHEPLNMVLLSRIYHLLRFIVWTFI